jgi:hypothetical protein
MTTDNMKNLQTKGFTRSVKGLHMSTTPGRSSGDIEEEVARESAPPWPSTTGTTSPDRPPGDAWLYRASHAGEFPRCFFRGEPRRYAGDPDRLLSGCRVCSGAQARRRAGVHNTWSVTVSPARSGNMRVWGARSSP